jgi:hypothetical protein
VPIPVDSGSLLTDTATHFCADVTVDKEISCNSGGVFSDIGQERANGDGTNGCAGTAGVTGIEAQWSAQNQGTIPLTCNLMESNPNFSLSGATGIVLSTGGTTPVPIGGGPTAPKECLAALDVSGVPKEPDTGTLSCVCLGCLTSLTGVNGVVDKTGGLSVFDSATFSCAPAIVPSFTSSKICALTNPSTDMFSTTVTVNNTDITGRTSLSCSIVDQYFSGMCPPSGPGTSLTLAPINLGAGPSTGTSTGSLTSSTTVCNQATVTCTPTIIATSTVLPTLTAQVDDAQCTIIPQLTNIKLKKEFSHDVVASGTTGAVTVTFTIINQSTTTTLTNVSFTDPFPADTIAAAQTPGNTCPGTSTASVTPGSPGSLTVTGVGPLGPGGSCTITVTLSTAAVTAPVRVCDMTSSVMSNQATGAPAYACLTISNQTTLVPLAPPDAYQILYAANLNIGDSVINLSNSGAFGLAQSNGDICINAYVFDPQEEMISCCNCLVTPDALNSWSISQDILSNTLTRGVPTSLVIKLLANTTDPGTCNATPTFQNLVPGAVAWGTTLEPNGVASYGNVPVRAKHEKLSLSELTALTDTCTFLQIEGSGFGVCSLCRTGGLGGAKH